jgi:hypothetical protein
MASRQREYQLRRQREGRCSVCGKEAVVVGYCQLHKEQRLARLREQRNAENPKNTTCTVCGNTGHNRRTCPRAEPRVEEGVPVDNALRR